MTSGSLSIQESGEALRHLCADVRVRLIARAAQLWQTPLDRCHAEDGCCRRFGSLIFVDVIDAWITQAPSQRNYYRDLYRNMVYGALD